MTVQRSGIQSKPRRGIRSLPIVRLLVLSSLVVAGTGRGQEARFPLQLAQGIMAGEVTQTSVILQSRLTAVRSRVDSRWSGVIGGSGVGRFEVSTTQDFRDPFYTGWLTAAPEYDYIVKTKLTGLQPGTRYFYRLSYGPAAASLRSSRTGTFRTHSPSQAADPVRFAIVTGMSYSRFHSLGSAFHPPYTGPDKALGYRALETIRRLRPDYFVGTGDNVYFDTPAVGRAETLQQLRMKFQEQFSQQRYIDLFSEVATYWMKDDHDYRYDDADPVNPFLGPGGEPKNYDAPEAGDLRVSGSGYAPSHELGIRTFREQLPLVDPEDADAVTYRTYRVNRLLQVWLVEGRDYRSANHLPDGPQKSIWGEKQKAWLKSTLLASDAAFKILISPTPIVGPDSNDKRDSHANPQGFRYEGEEFFRWLQQEGFLRKNFFIVCGDRHWKYHSIHPAGFEEFSTGALIDQNAVEGIFPGDPESSDPEGKIRQPYHDPEPQGGFLLLTVSPGQESGSAQAEFTFYDEDGALLYQQTKQAQRTQ